MTGIMGNPGRIIVNEKIDNMQTLTDQQQQMIDWLSAAVNELEDAVKESDTPDDKSVFTQHALLIDGPCVEVSQRLVALLAAVVAEVKQDLVKAKTNKQRLAIQSSGLDMIAQTVEWMIGQIVDGR